MDWVDNLVENYYRWLVEKTTVHEDNRTGWTMISTPFLGLFNDSIEIYVRRKNEEIYFSDDEQTMRNLELSGVSLKRSKNRKEILNKIMLNYGVKLEGLELTAKSSVKSFPQTKHNFISAISEILDMHVLTQQTVSTIFKEDVKKYLDDQNIIYTPQFISKGSTNLDFTFDFQIAYKTKEIVVKAFNSLNKMNLPHFLFTWNDIKEVREKITGKKLVSLAIINDKKNTVKDEFLNALTKKGSEYILWNQRNMQSSIDKFSETMNYN
jgi:hypothetical protein